MGVALGEGISQDHRIIEATGEDVKAHGQRGVPAASYRVELRRLRYLTVTASMFSARHVKVSYLVPTATPFAALTIIDATACGCDTYTA